MEEAEATGELLFPVSRRVHINLIFPDNVHKVVYAKSV